MGEEDPPRLSWMNSLASIKGGLDDINGRSETGEEEGEVGGDLVGVKEDTLERFSDNEEEGKERVMLLPGEAKGAPLKVLPRRRRRGGTNSRCSPGSRETYQTTTLVAVRQLPASPYPYPHGLPP